MHRTERLSPAGSLILALAASLVGGCGADPEPLVAGEMVAPERIVAGELLRLEFRWTPLPAFPDPELPWRIFVRITDQDGRQLLNDYHAPEPAIAGWVPGQEVAYTHWVTLPRIAPGTRIDVAAGLDDGVGEIPISTPSRSVTTRLRGRVRLVDAELPGAPRYGEGWHPPSEGFRGRQRGRWSGARAVVQLRAPEAGGTLHLRAFGASAWVDGPQRVQLLLDGHELASFEAPQLRAIRRSLPVPPRLMPDEAVELEIRVHPVYVPDSPSDTPPADTPTEPTGSKPTGYGIQVTLLYLEARQDPLGGEAP